jgi:hypothetical protein
MNLRRLPKIRGSWTMTGTRSRIESFGAVDTLRTTRSKAPTGKTHELPRKARPDFVVERTFLDHERPGRGLE